MIEEDGEDGEGDESHPHEVGDENVVAGVREADPQLCRADPDQCHHDGDGNEVMGVGEFKCAQYQTDEKTIRAKNTNTLAGQCNLSSPLVSPPSGSPSRLRSMCPTRQTCFTSILYLVF